MKTKSCWGNPPKRLYKFINLLDKTIGNSASICIIGGSDGKFVIPFLRKGYSVTAFDFDSCALNGGEKLSPIKRSDIQKIKYKSSNTKPLYTPLPTTNTMILGLKQRAELEGVSEKLTIIEKDFYREPIQEKFDVIFTSCSIQYKSNHDIPIDEIMDKILSHININGYLYMDYMMPLEDAHSWKSLHFFRTGEIRKYFTTNWEILHLKEMRVPVFEKAHIDRPEDHFHRFGYILAKRTGNI